LPDQHRGVVNEEADSIMSFTWLGSSLSPEPEEVQVTGPTTIVTRTARSGNGHRVYTADDDSFLLGYVELVPAVNARDQPCRRWRASAAAMAFLAPGCPAIGAVPRWLFRPDPTSRWLPGAHTSKHAAVTELIAYLVASRAPAVGFGPHPDVAAPAASR
jgi:hypothetical protein